MKPLRARRLADGPIIGPESHPSIGTNIQGPSVIRAPEWLPDPLGRYLLYFADHKGSFIRLASADEIDGPWTVHPAGSLQLADSHFLTEPLWGVGSTAPYLHDGRAATLNDAILAHGGEAKASRDAFAALTSAQQAEIIAFLEDKCMGRA